MVLTLNEKQTATAFGTFAALVHVAWSALVATGFAQGWLNFVLGLHSLESPVTVGAFNLTTALTLIAVTFIVGYVFGIVFARVWNWAGKQKHF